MNKARRKIHKQSIAKRLVRESLILSTTRFVSSRAVGFFEKGGASFLLNSVKAADSFARERITGPLFKKVQLRKNYTKPARNAVASFFSNNSFLRGLASLRTTVLNSSLRSVGIFLLTFGIYAAAIFLLKRFVTLSVGEAHPDDLIISGLTAIAGLLLSAFGDKSVLGAIGSGRISGSLLSGALGVNDSSLDKAIKKKPKTSVGTGFLLGSLLGVLTMFFTPLSILLAILCGSVAIAIINIPEFGLLLTVVSLSVLPVNCSAVIASVTVISYLLKCIRLKRNLRFGTADGAVLLLLAAVFIRCLVTDGIQDGEGYLLCFMALYFAAKNLICSEKLIMQTFNALCLGVFAGMLVYVLGEFAYLIPHSQLRLAAMLISDNALGADMLAMLASAVMPFALSSFSSLATKRRDLLFVLLAAICAFVSDSLLFYGLLAVSLFVFIASAFKAPFGALLGAVIVMPALLTIVSDFTCSSAVTAFVPKSFDSALNMSMEAKAITFWDGLYYTGGTVASVLCVASVTLILQRVFAGAVLSKSPKITLVCGTVAASAVMMLLGTFIFNLFADLRTVAMLWFLLGLCGSVYKVYGNAQYSLGEV